MDGCGAATIVITTITSSVEPMKSLVYHSKEEECFVSEERQSTETTWLAPKDGGK